MRAYAHLPAPTGLHAKLLRELSSENSKRYAVFPLFNLRANNVFVTTREDDGEVWAGHRDSMPAEYRGAFDPYNVLTRPASD